MVFVCGGIVECGFVRFGDCWIVDGCIFNVVVVLVGFYFIVGIVIIIGRVIGVVDVVSGGVVVVVCIWVEVIIDCCCIWYIYFVGVRVFFSVFVIVFVRFCVGYSGVVIGGMVDVCSVHLIIIVGEFIVWYVFFFGVFVFNCVNVIVIVGEGVGCIDVVFIGFVEVICTDVVIFVIEGLFRYIFFIGIGVFYCV